MGRAGLRPFRSIPFVLRLASTVAGQEPMGSGDGCVGVLPHASGSATMPAHTTPNVSVFIASTLLPNGTRAVIELQIQESRIIRYQAGVLRINGIIG
jgi:hypothetical protein